MVVTRPGCTVVTSASRAPLPFLAGRRGKKGNNCGLMASRRLTTTAARLPSVAASSTAQFPPQQSLYERADVPKVAFDPEAWAATQPPPSSALIAFAHRLGLSTVMNSPETVQMTCTHPSFVHLHRRVCPDAPRPETNGQLSALGNALLGMFSSEFVHAAYPYLPTRVWRAATAAYVGSGACAHVAREMGATPLLRWHRTVSWTCDYSRLDITVCPQPQQGSVLAVMHDDALASVPRAITGLLYQQRSLLSARQFVHSYFLSRHVDLQGMLKFVDPKDSLLEMVRKFGRERPVSRCVFSSLPSKIDPHISQTAQRDRPVLQFARLRGRHLFWRGQAWRGQWQLPQDGRVPRLSISLVLRRCC